MTRVKDTSTLVGHFVPEKGRKEIEEIVEEIKEREERGTGMKVKKQQL